MKTEKEAAPKGRKPDNLRLAKKPRKSLNLRRRLPVTGKDAWMAR